MKGFFLGLFWILGYASEEKKIGGSGFRREPEPMGEGKGSGSKHLLGCGVECAGV